MKRWREGRRDKEKGGGVHTGMKDKGRECVCVACVCIHMWVSRILMRAATTPSDIPVLFFKRKKRQQRGRRTSDLGPQHYSTASTRIKFKLRSHGTDASAFRSLPCIAVLTEVCYKYLAMVTRTATNLQPPKLPISMALFCVCPQKSPLYEPLHLESKITYT